MCHQNERGKGNRAFHKFRKKKRQFIDRTSSYLKQMVTVDVVVKKDSGDVSFRKQGLWFPVVWFDRGKTIPRLSRHGLWKWHRRKMYRSKRTIQKRIISQFWWCRHLSVLIAYQPLEREKSDRPTGSDRPAGPCNSLINLFFLKHPKSFLTFFIILLVCFLLFYFSLLIPPPPFFHDRPLGVSESESESQIESDQFHVSGAAGKICCGTAFLFTAE